MHYSSLCRFLIVPLLMSLVIFSAFHSTDQPMVTAEEPEMIWAKFCSGCHGVQMVAFTDRQWKNGNSDSALLASINKGNVEKGMPPFATAFSEPDKKALVVYIQSGIKNAGKYITEEKMTSNIVKTENNTFRLDTLFSGIKNPWSMDLLPGGEMLVTDRAGKLFHVKANMDKQEISGVPEVRAAGQGGLFDIKIDPAYPTNSIIYLSYAKGVTSDSGAVNTTAVVRARLEGGMLKDVKEIFEAKPYQKTEYHYGGRMEFGKDGYLYITVGDRGKHFVTAQSVDNDGGKVHRIKTDGSIPADNPFVKVTGAHASVYSLGHRNPQGMAIHPVTGEIWTNEHGPRGGDEVNIVKAGKNYGWPVITWGLNYDGTILSKETVKPGMEQPLLYWVPSIAPSGMAFVKGNKYKGWNNALLVGSLRFKYLNVCYLQGSKIVKEETVMNNVGRVRDVRMGPDGFVYVIVEDPGYVFRLAPML